MNQQIDRNKIRYKIQSTNTKDILYLTVNSVETKSSKLVIKEIERFLGKGGGEVVVLRK
jgi:hypothetical protein